METEEVFELENVLNSKMTENEKFDIIIKYTETNQQNMKAIIIGLEKYRYINAELVNSFYLKSGIKEKHTCEYTEAMACFSRNNKSCIDEFNKEKLLGKTPRSETNEDLCPPFNEMLYKQETDQTKSKDECSATKPCVFSSKNKYEYSLKTIDLGKLHLPMLLKFYQNISLKVNKVAKRIIPCTENIIKRPKLEEELIDISEDIINLLYFPLQCNICGFRFRSSESGKDDMGFHLEEHGRKTKYEENMKRLGVTYFCSVEEFLKDSVIQIDYETLQMDLELENEKVFVKGNVICAICSEKIECQWDDDEEEWVVHNVIKRRDGSNKLMHRSCIE